jgi:hypothetical protein
MLMRRRAVQTADVPPDRADAPAARRRGVGDQAASGPIRSRPATSGRVAGAVADGGLLLVRCVRLVAAVVIAIIALAIAFVVLDASSSNTIVSHVRDWAHTLAAPFRGIFHLHSAKGTFALNYGIAIVVYALVAGLVVRLIAAVFAPAARRAPVA